MRNFLDTSCRANNTHFMFNNISSKNYAICEVMLTKMVQPNKPQMTI